MKIWLDLANSPQVLFFRPVLAELQRRGHTVSVTTRAYAQTVQLTDQLGIPHTVIGQHGGRGQLGLARQLALRAMSLARWASSQRFDLALSHNSYSQAMAAAMLRVPIVTLMDYEHQPLNHLCFRLAKCVLVPEAFPKDLLDKYGAGRKSLSYPGVKEQIYLADFEPQPDYLQKESLPCDRPLVVIRPPAPWTAYHRFENDIFDQLLHRLDAEASAYLLFLPRLASQADSVRALPNIHVATKVYDGPNLLYYATLAISGGGTMNREAAVLGTCTYTIFKGKLGAVDRYLIEKGRMTQLQTEADLAQVQTSSAQRLPMLAGQALVASLTDQILSAI